MVAFYKHDIPAWMDGTEALSDGAYRAYHVICQLIYLNEGPIALNERGIAGRCNQRIVDFRRNFKELQEAGKLTLLDGRIANARAESELAKIVGNRTNASGGGRRSGEARRAAAEAKARGKSAANVASDEGRRVAEGVPDGSGRVVGGVQTQARQVGDDMRDASKSLKNNDTVNDVLHKDRSLKEKRREEKTPHQPPDLSAKLRVGVVRAFEIANSPNLPDTSRADVWLAQGFDPEICLSVVRDLVTKNPAIGTLSYFEPAIRRAHEARPPPSEPTVMLGGRRVPEKNVKAAIERYRSGAPWHDPFGYPPDDPRTSIPEHLRVEVAA